MSEIPIFCGIVLLALSDDLINSRRFFIACFIFSILCFLLGLILFLNIRDLHLSSKLVIFSVTLIYLTCFEILRTTFKNVTDENPSITSRPSIIGGDANDGLFTKPPKSKKI